MQSCNDLFTKIVVRVSVCHIMHALNVIDNIVD